MTDFPGSLDASADNRGELDEIFLDAENVHIERMNSRGFWIGVTRKNGDIVHINTGVSKGVWFFNVEDTKLDGTFYSVQKPASYVRRADKGETK